MTQFQDLEKAFYSTTWTIYASNFNTVINKDMLKGTKAAHQARFAQETNCIHNNG